MDSQYVVIAAGVLVSAEDHTVDCCSYKGMLWFTRMSVIAEWVG